MEVLHAADDLNLTEAVVTASFTVPQGESGATGLELVMSIDSHAVGPAAIMGSYLQASAP